jgi:hypothetical protein
MLQSWHSFRGLTYSQRYRRRDPTDADEAEFMENVFDSLCSALAESEIKDLFLKSEGVDLMVLMMKYILPLFFRVGLDLSPQRQDASLLTGSQNVRPCNVRSCRYRVVQCIRRGIRPQVLIQRFHGKGLF